ncbi:hypothetical protein [Geomesophilobacter sediminis]|uniref:Tetratricopeptide repeat protein n=1 Tax=Geomesophilobacter sediminis TaxID=2798584 RepID=A0A8J7IPU4_9BACT|nr:hypothetical protein [Geomesophilobacter sediminis]MBJ6725703.1 hypothetical protein [Geomesophilobacter sediminis]
MDKAKTIALNIAVAAVIAIIFLWANTLYRQHVQFDKGNQAFKAEDFTGAVAGYEAAIHMYTPGSSVVERSAERLWQLGTLMEQQRDTARALVAYRALRSSFYGVRWFAQPGKDWIAKCDARIAALVKLQGGR